jgi:hypothetical protein
MLWFAPLVYALTVPVLVILSRRHRKHREATMQPPLSAKERIVHAAIVIVALPIPFAAFWWWIATERHARFSSAATALYFLVVSVVALCTLFVLKRVASHHAQA